MTYSYDAWGNVLSESDGSGIGLATMNPFLYKGYWYDWSTGLYYLNARYYNPAWGRFISPDPVGLPPGDTASYNAYEYAGNNPLVMTDPSGDMPVPPPGVPETPHVAALLGQSMHSVMHNLQEALVLQNLKSAAEALETRAAWFSGCATGAGWASLVAGGPVDPVGILFGGVALACELGAAISGTTATFYDARLAKSGHGSWGTVGLDAAGTILSLGGLGGTSAVLYFRLARGAEGDLPVWAFALDRYGAGHGMGGL